MKENLKRYLGLLLVIVMVAGMMPASAFADTFTSNVISPLQFEDEQAEKRLVADYVSGSDVYRVTMTYTSDALIPDNSVLVVSEILPGTPEYDAYVAESAGALGWEEGTATDSRVLDISVFYEGQEVQPSAPVTVEIVLVDQPADDWNVVHFGKKETQVLESTAQGDAVSFETAGFSVYVLTKSKLEKTLVASDGNTYNITLTYDDKAGIPDNAELKVTEILQEVSPEYDEYLSKAEGTLEENQRVTFARFFDITILSDGQEIQPSTPVEVKIELANEELTAEETEDVKAVHFSSEGDVTALDTTRDSQTVTFNADGFSVYGIFGTETLTTQVITASGDTYEISVTYGPEAEIPAGAVLFAKEIVDSEEYDEYFLRAENALLDEHSEVDISFARFFDIEIRVNNEKIEPKAPVEVLIRNASAPNIDSEESMNIVHFTDDGPEIINDLSISDDGKEITYNQFGFSVTGEVAGTFSGNSWPSSPAGDYVLVVYSGNGGPYYAVNSNGGLVQVDYDPETGKVTFPDSVAPTMADLRDYWWTYYVSNGNHRLTSVANTNNRICPEQSEGGSAVTNSTSIPGANQGYIYRGNQNNRYCVAINGTRLISSKVTYNYYTGYTYPSNAAHFIFVNKFEEDITGAYGTAESTVLTGNSRTLRMAEVTTSDETLIDFEGFTWRSSNTSVATVTTDPNTDAPIATAVSVGTTRIIGTRTNLDGETDEVIWTVTVKDLTNNSIVFLHQPQDNNNFANQDNIRPHEGYGDTEPTNYVKFVVALADEAGNIKTYNGKPDVELPDGSIVPERYEFELDSSGVFVIGEDTLSGISVPGYSYAGTYAYFGWINNTDLENMAVVSEFKNIGAISSRYANYYSVLGFKTSRGNPQYQDYSQTAFGDRGYGYYAYNPTGVLMIVLQPVSGQTVYRTSYHNDYVPGGTARTNIVDTTRAKMIQGEWIPSEYRWDWYGETIMTQKTGADLTSPADGYEFVGWFDAVDSEGNGTGNQIIGQTEEGYFYAIKNGEKIIIRQNNDIYAKWQLVRGTINIEKTIDGDLTEEELNSLKGKIKFIVTDNTSEEKITKTGSDITWNEKTGTVSISGLSAATTYTVTESDAEVETYDVTTEIFNGENIKVSKTGAITVPITNTYVKNVAPIKVMKIDSVTSDPLSNAQFSINEEPLNTGEEGYSRVIGIPVSETAYDLVETNAPSGYNKLSSPVEVTVSSSGVTYVQSDYNDGESQTAEKDTSDGSYVIKVRNTSGTELPETGGIGTDVFAAVGGVMALFAGAVLVLRRRRKAFEA